VFILLLFAYLSSSKRIRYCRVNGRGSYVRYRCPSIKFERRALEEVYNVRLLWTETPFVHTSASRLPCHGQLFSPLPSHTSSTRYSFKSGPRSRSVCIPHARVHASTLCGSRLPRKKRAKLQLPKCEKDHFNLSAKCKIDMCTRILCNGESECYRNTKRGTSGSQDLLQHEGESSGVSSFRQGKE